MELHIREENGFKYIDEGNGEVLLLLHGLFGALSNWTQVTEYFSKKYRVIIPMMPIYDMPIKEAGLEGLLKFLEDFIIAKKIHDLTLIGNSLGGHVGLIYTLRNQHKVNRLVLTGSSGLFENTMGASYPRRGSYEFVKKKVEYTFYDPKIATQELIDEVFEITKSIPTCLRMVAIARSAQKHNMAKELPKIRIPTLLIWGLNDTITPPIVAHEFDKLIPNTELRFIDRCGHAPMMEHPEEFNKIFENFLERNKVLI
ncbi:MAG: alpha/beta hydrolase [Bacteroidota bacterium]